MSACHVPGSVLSARPIGINAMWFFISGSLVWGGVREPQTDKSKMAGLANRRPVDVCVWFIQCFKLLELIADV